MEKFQVLAYLDVQEIWSCDVACGTRSPRIVANSFKLGHSVGENGRKKDMDLVTWALLQLPTVSSTSPLMVMRKLPLNAGSHLAFVTVSIPQGAMLYLQP